MKVILRRDKNTLGKIGEVISVKDGYARNFLIPREYVFTATPTAIKALEIEKKKLVKKFAKEKEEAKKLASILSEQQVSIAMKVGEEGRLYGSVTPQMIAQELVVRGFNVDRRSIIIDEPIKSLGIFDVKIKLHPEVTTKLKTWVINED